MRNSLQQAVAYMSLLTGLGVFWINGNMPIEQMSWQNHLYTIWGFVLFLGSSQLIYIPEQIREYLVNR